MPPTALTYRPTFLRCLTLGGGRTGARRAAESGAGTAPQTT